MRFLWAMLVAGLAVAQQAPLYRDTNAPVSGTYQLGAGHFQASPGAFEISVSGKQPGFKGAADASTTATLSARIRVTGPPAQVN